jgi:hypothetical protein
MPPRLYEKRNYGHERTKEAGLGRHKPEFGIMESVRPEIVGHAAVNTSGVDAAASRAGGATNRSGWS